VIEAEDWTEAFAAVEGAAPHNLAREILWEELAEIVGAKLAMHLEDPPGLPEVRRALDQDPELVRLVQRSWPLLDAADLVADLFEVPAYLRRCAPSLTPQQVRLLQREDPRAWTVADLPLLDAARHRLGDPGAEARERRRAAQQRDLVEEVELALEDLIAADGSEMQEMSMLRGQDMRGALADRAVVEVPPPDLLAGPFGHIVVDEAQELDDAQWAMILRRCPSRSLTLVGDRAQATAGFSGSWQERLSRVGLSSVRSAGLSLNYRTPREIMEQAEPVIRSVLPGAAVPTSVRSSGIPVRHARPAELEEVVSTWLARNAQGTVAVIGAAEQAAAAARALAPRGGERVQVLTPALSKGLEADLVVLAEPDRLQPAEHYVAMTRATRELVLLDR
jgi:superfamily I DNA/RNA helicase